MYIETDKLIICIIRSVLLLCTILNKTVLNINLEFKLDVPLVTYMYSVHMTRALRTDQVIQDEEWGIMSLPLPGGEYRAAT